jgi:hypothetical protein
MAIKRGATTTPLVVPEKPTVSLGSAPAAIVPGRCREKPVADQLRSILDPLIKADDGGGAEAQLLIYAPQLSAEARAEAATRVAFVYYVLGLDLDARRVSDTWRQGATGEWASQGAWISALASWRIGDLESASRDFQQVAAVAQQRELRAGGLYWAARAEQACRRPASVEPLLRAAAESPESFYGRARARDARHDHRTAHRFVRRQGPADRTISERPAGDRAGADRRARAGRGK